MFEATRLDEVAAKVVRTLMERNPKVKPTMIEDFGIGNAGNTSDLVLLGGISRLAGLPAETTNFFSNRQCGSSMETMQRIAMSIMVGAMDCGISLGVERMGTDHWRWQGRRAASKPCDRDESENFRKIQTPARHGRRSFQLFFRSYSG